MADNCSKRCREKAKKPPVPVAVIDATCPCGRAFQKTTWREWRKRFCTRACRYRYYEAEYLARTGKGATDGGETVPQTPPDHAGGLPKRLANHRTNS